MTDELVISKYFLMIPTGAAHDEILLKQPKAILVLGEIVSMLNVTNEFYASNSYLAEKLHCSKRAIQSYLGLLEERGLIKRVVEKDSNGMFVKRKITAGDKLGEAFAEGWQRKPSAIDFTPSEADNTTPHETDNTTPTNAAAPKYNNNNKNSNNNINNKRVKKKRAAPSPIKKANKQFEDEFEKIWELYPKKIGKKAARTHYIHWRKENEKEHTPHYLVQQLVKYKKYIEVNNIDYQYIKAGSTWFNGGYEDDFTLPTPKPRQNDQDYGFNSLDQASGYDSN